MSWVDNIVNSIRIATGDTTKSSGMPEGIWTKCNRCQQPLLKERLVKSLYVCPSCDHHMSMPARARLAHFLDEQDAEEQDATLEPIDVLKFKDTKKYTQRISQDQEKTDEKEALISYKGRINGMAVVACAFEFCFLGGSMGSVVGEKFVRAAETALADGVPFVCFAASGGARMQENMFSLMQMARTAAAIEALKKNAIPYISVMTHPTFGGVSASLAMLGDINIAEPNALIGFAGPKVIEQTVKQKLPKGFQTSEFLLERGMLDMIVTRHEMRTVIARVLNMMSGVAT